MELTENLVVYSVPRLHGAENSENDIGRGLNEATVKGIAMTPGKN
jgi:hypothetical protein